MTKKYKKLESKSRDKTFNSLKILKLSFRTIILLFDYLSPLFLFINVLLLIMYQYYIWKSMTHLKVSCTAQEVIIRILRYTHIRHRMEKEMPRLKHSIEAGVKTIRESAAGEVHLLRSRQNLINLWSMIATVCGFHRESSFFSSCKYFLLSLRHFASSIYKSVVTWTFTLFPSSHFSCLWSKIWEPSLSRVQGLRAKNNSYLQSKLL